MTLHQRVRGSRPRHDDEAGISIVELLAAIVILSIVLGGLAQSLIGALRATVVQEARVQGTAFANELLEDVRVIEYDLAVFCRTEAETEFGAPLQVDGEEVVVVPDSSRLCDGDPLTGEALPVEETVPDRNGFTYTVRRILTWVDDDADGLGLADADGPRDYKRLQVEVEWVADGQTQNLQTETQRAPEGFEQALTSSVDPRVVSIDDSGFPTEPFTLTLQSIEQLAAASVAWTGRGGIEQAPIGMATTDGGFTWEIEFVVGSILAPFGNGETLFEFSATDDEANPYEDTVTVLFLQDLELRDLDGDGSPDIDITPNRIEIDQTGAICSLDVNFGLEGILRSDSVAVQIFDSSNTLRVEQQVPVDQPQDWGSTYVANFTGSTDFPTAIEGNEGGSNFAFVDIVVDAERFDGESLVRTLPDRKVFQVVACP